MLSCCILLVYYLFWFFFFFSSRRRHTRCLSDWSSDVCSSDLAPASAMPMAMAEAGAPIVARRRGFQGDGKTLSKAAREVPKTVQTDRARACRVLEDRKSVV